jgi:hypothetical protein
VVPLTGVLFILIRNLGTSILFPLFVEIFIRYLDVPKSSIFLGGGRGTFYFFQTDFILFSIVLQLLICVYGMRRLRQN